MKMLRIILNRSEQLAEENDITDNWGTPGVILVPLVGDERWGFTYGGLWANEPWESIVWHRDNGDAMIGDVGGLYLMNADRDLTRHAVSDQPWSDLFIDVLETETRDFDLGDQCVYCFRSTMHSGYVNRYPSDRVVGHGSNAPTISGYTCGYCAADIEAEADEARREDLLGEIAELRGLAMASNDPDRIRDLLETIRDREADLAELGD